MLLRPDSRNQVRAPFGVEVVKVDPPTSVALAVREVGDEDGAGGPRRRRRAGTRLRCRSKATRRTGDGRSGRPGERRAAADGGHHRAGFRVGPARPGPRRGRQRRRARRQTCASDGAGRRSTVTVPIAPSPDRPADPLRCRSTLRNPGPGRHGPGGARRRGGHRARAVGTWWRRSGPTRLPRSSTLPASARAGTIVSVRVRTRPRMSRWSGPSPPRCR